MPNHPAAAPWRTLGTGQQVPERAGKRLWARSAASGNLTGGGAWVGGRGSGWAGERLGDPAGRQHGEWE